MTEIVLWSGGLDSTILLCHLAKNFKIQPVYLKIGTVGERHEVKIVQELSQELRSKFPHVLPIKIISNWKWQFSKFPRIKENRNLRICEFMKSLGAKKIFMGGYVAGSHFPEDNNPFRLSELAQIEVWNWERLYPGFTKEDVFKIGVKELGLEFLEKTWSCQLWWNSPCDQCFSCVERNYLFKKYQEVKIFENIAFN